MWDTDKAIQVPESDVIRIHIPHRLFRRPGEDSSQDGDDFEMKIALMKEELTINFFFKIKSTEALPGQMCGLLSHKIV